MPGDRDIPPLRYLAPIALAICTIAFLWVALGSGGGGDSKGSAAKATRETTTTTRGRGGRKTTTVRKPAAERSSYTVKLGDSIAGIADKVSVPVEKIQELNPDLDPQGLVPGQKIKLRQ
jgi:LysM repeat protein